MSTGLRKLPLVDASLDELVRMGANARRLGHTAFRNPFLVPVNWPQATGESGKGWQAKADAWLIGWELEERWLTKPAANDGAFHRLR